MNYLNDIAREMNAMSKRFLWEMNEELGFPKPTRLVFYTGGLKDQDPVKWEKTDFGYKATMKTLGVEKAKIKLVDDGIEVSGKNVIDDEDFGTIMPLPLKDDVLQRIKEIKHKTIAGITIVELILEDLTSKVKITDEN